jgi:aryl-alcohol dehydrogenase-like predicted oxidoreductase
VRFFDTAQAYGTSEQVLGQCFRNLQIAGEVRVISKLAPALPPSEYEGAVRRSLAALGVPRLWALLLHTESLLDEWPAAIGETLRGIRRAGLVERLGVSIYSPERAQQALDSPDIEVIQVPANVFDRRLLGTGFFERAVQQGKQVFIRSVYLQGLALLAEHDAPAFAAAAVRTYGEFCRRHDLAAAAFAVAYLRQLAPAAMLVIGAERPEQAVANCRLLEQGSAPAALCAAWNRAWPDDVPALINPTLWPRTHS